MRTHTKRTTIYLDSDIHRALRVKAAETDHSVSAIIEEAVESALAEDAADLAAFGKRKNERSLSFEDVLGKLKKNGKI